MHTHHSEWVLILDFGSQYTQLIARRVRELQVYCEIHPFNVDLSQFESHAPKGVILSGGPMSVNDVGAPHLNTDIFDWNVPILGVCYGLQIIAHTVIPGSVSKAAKREFGRAQLLIDEENSLFDGISDKTTVWMSHGDHLKQLPSDYHVIAHTSNAPIAAVRHNSKPIYGVQFHPEVVHTDDGKQLLGNFIKGICALEGTWTPSSFIESTIEEVRTKVGNDKVICGLSGGVDSTVTAVLLHKALGDKLLCIFVDNGLLRKNEFQTVLDLYKRDLHLPVIGIDATDLFLDRLKGVTDPEGKRKIIGNTFIDVFDEAIRDKSEYNYRGLIKYIIFVSPD